MMKNPDSKTIPGMVRRGPPLPPKPLFGFSLALTAGAGFEYQLENRHYALGLGADAFLLTQFDAVKAVDTHF